MNMLNFIRGKIEKIQVDSPSKKAKNISPYQQIYLDQLNNYIEAGGGYTVLRQKLFRDINNNYMHDSPLVQEIVGMLRKGLDRREKDKERRCVAVVEELVEHCGRVMNQAFNDRAFCEVLAGTAVYLRKLKSAERDQIRERACGIFLYWHLKFKSQPNYVYNYYYQKLLKQQAEFPTIPYIKDSKPQQPPKPNAPELSQQQLKNVQQIVLDCQQTATQTQEYLKLSPHKIDTNYVRLLKAKTKKLYALSTAVAGEGAVVLSQGEKERIGRVYKKIRGQLKEIERVNEENAKAKALEKEKQYLIEKMEVISPKKTQKQIPKLQTTPIKSQKKLVEPIISSQQPPITITPKKVPSSTQLQQQQQEKKHEQISYDRDLLDIEVSNKTAFSETPKKNATVGVTVPVVASGSALKSNRSLLDDDEQVVANGGGKEQQLATPVKNQHAKVEYKHEVLPVGYDASNKSSDVFQIDIDQDLKDHKILSTPKKNNSVHSSTSLHQRNQLQQYQNQQQKLKQKYSEQQKPFSPKTPPKSSKPQNYQKLLDLDADSHENDSSVSEKRINFKQLYSANQLSPELKDLDLSGKKITSKESLRSQEKEEEKEFGDYV